RFGAIGGWQRRRYDDGIDSARGLAGEARLAAVSLIADALKTAQREKQRRESGARSGISPVLVPLRVVSEPGVAPGRALTMGLSSIVIIASVTVMVLRVKGSSTRPTPPSISASSARASVPSSISASARRPAPIRGRPSGYGAGSAAKPPVASS